MILDTSLKLLNAVMNRVKQFTILAVAEGAISKEDAQLSKKQYKAKLAKRKYSTVGYELASQIVKSNRSGSACHYSWSYTAWRKPCSI